MKIIGISAYYHDSAAAIVEDGRILAAAQEERFSRQKHDPRFPMRALRYCLQEAGLSVSDADAVVFYDKPFLKFERLLETYLATAPRGLRSFYMAMPVWLRQKLFLKRTLIENLRRIDAAVDRDHPVLFSEHHLSHAASAFYPSPFEEAVVLTLDGVGEWATTSVALGAGKDLTIQKEIHFPHSLGLLYSAFTYYIGFKVNSGEYKLMGLAPYGSPKYTQVIYDNIIDVKEDGSFFLHQEYFNYAAGLTMTNARFHKLFGQPPRKPETEPLTDFHADVAASIQRVTEEIMLRLVRGLAADYSSRNLCLAGGVALNCVANGRLLRESPFEHIWVQPAAGDAGGAVGAALAAYHLELGRPREICLPDGMHGGYLGSSYATREVERRLSALGANLHVLNDAGVVEATAEALANGDAVGWFYGRMEFGPRALGARSILADPRQPDMQKTLNLKIKFRESFRPFAPSVLAEYCSDWFDLQAESPYMLMVAEVAKDKRIETSRANAERAGFLNKLNVPRSVVPSITHVDYSARIQTVHAGTNPRYHALLSRFNELTGCPVLVNTSFNIRGEPIVESPEDAYRCFMGTDLDMLVCENVVLYKKEQDSASRHDYRSDVPLD